MSGPAQTAVEAAGIPFEIVLISLGAGEHGVGIRLTAEDAAAALQATFADVTDPAQDIFRR